MTPGKRTLRRALGVVLLGTTQGCSSLLLPDDPPDDPRSVAAALWTEVDEYYPWFSLKGIDWDAVADTELADIGSPMSDQELFDRLADMLEILRDGHVALTAPFGRRSWDGWYAGHPENFDPAVAHAYLGPPTGSAAGGVVTWGLLQPRIGYVHVTSFGRNDIAAGVDQALASLGALDGLVLDIRSNGGGSDSNSEAVAARFAERRVHYRTVRYKSGSGHEDFGPEIKAYIEPGGDTRFLGPVVLLQNRRVFSAAEDFVLAMRALPSVTAVGDTTGGGSGNPIGRELPNGWIASVPRWREWTASGEIFEGIGLAPDEVVAAPDAGLAQGRDAILERAVELLGGG
jgi:hypothetical protein